VRRVFWQLGLGLAGTCAASAAQLRFPPPEFESGYQMPSIAYPPPRALPLEYLDVVVLVLALALASYLVLKRRSRKAVLGLSVFSLAYFGFYREGCVCAIGSVQNVALALAQPTYAVPLAVMVFFAAPLLFTLLFGRTFCAAVCPHGALQDLVLWKPVRVPAWLEKGLGVIPYVYLGAGVLFAATGSGFIICRYDPFVPIFRVTGSFGILLVGAGFLLVGLFVGRPYCRFLCPYGALLRLAGKACRWQPRITPDVCTQCQLCADSCPYGAILEPAEVPPRRRLLRERARLGWLLIATPLWIALGVWLGFRLAPVAAQVHPSVRLAARYLEQQRGELNKDQLTQAELLELRRADRTADELLAEAATAQKQFRIGTPIFGGFVGLVIALRLLGFSIWRKQTDYEPDPGACYACARCFLSCPQERLRLGLAPLEDEEAEAEPAAGCAACGVASPPGGAASAPTRQGGTA